MSVLYRHTFTWQLNEKKKVWVLDGKKKKKKKKKAWQLNGKKGLVLIKEIKEATKSRL